MLLKCCTQYASKFGKLSSGHRTGKGQFLFQSQRRANAKKYSNSHTTACVSHARKVMLKIFQARLQQYVNWELLDVQAGFRRGRGTRDQLVYIHLLIEKGSFRKTSTSVTLTMLKLLTMDHNKLWEILQEMGIPDHLTASWETCTKVKKQ